MGSLTPGARLIYESPDGGKTVYARQEGSSDKILIGYNLPTKRKDPLDCKHNMSLWEDILDASLENAALKDILDRAKILYYLSKTDGSKT